MIRLNRLINMSQRLNVAENILKKESVNKYSLFKLI